VSEIAERDLFTSLVDDDQEDVAEQMSKYDLLAVPVIDENGCLLGIVTVDDALDVLEEEADEDLELATGRKAGMAVAGLWQWVSRDGWLVVWSIAFLAAAAFARWAISTNAFTASNPAAADAAMLPLIGVLLSPVVLRVAEDVSSHAVSRVIEVDEDDRPAIWSRLWRDGLSGLGLGAVIGLVTFGVIDLVLGALGMAGARIVAGAGGSVLGVSVLIVTLAGTVVGWRAEARALADKRVSNLGIAMTLMAVGVISTVVLLIGVVMLASSTGTTV